MEVCNKDICYKGGGRHRAPWCQKTAARKHLSAILKEILLAARERRWKSGRHDEGGGGREVAKLKFNAGSEGPRYAGTEKGDAQVGE